MFTTDPSKRLVISLSLAATNIFSFAFGVSVAGKRTTSEIASVAGPVPVKTPSPSPKASPKSAQHPSAPKHVAKAAPVVPAAPPPATADRPLPIAGKGMWIYEFDHIMGGDVTLIVDVAKAYGMTHLYVRAGTSLSGLNTWPDIARILPYAHAKGLKVIAWYFPYLRRPGKDANRTLRVIRSEVKGHRVDGFAADIETPAEGTKLSAKRVKQYINAVRKGAPKAFIVLVPPRPSKFTIRFYPYHLVPRFDAVAPMVYWGRFDPRHTTAAAVSYLKRYGKPIAPIGQVYDMGPEGGPKGRPKPAAIQRFMAEARSRGSVGLSFWSWQHSTPIQWGAIRAFPWP